MWEKLNMKIFAYNCWPVFSRLLHTLTISSAWSQWGVMSHDSKILVFIMKAMVWYFVQHSYKVMTVLVLVVLILFCWNWYNDIESVILELPLQFHRSVVDLSSLCFLSFFTLVGFFYFWFHCRCSYFFLGFRSSFLELASIVAEFPCYCWPCDKLTMLVNVSHQPADILGNWWNQWGCYVGGQCHTWRCGRSLNMHITIAGVWTIP